MASPEEVEIVFTVAGAREATEAAKAAAAAIEKAAAASKEEATAAAAAAAATKKEAEAERLAAQAAQQKEAADRRATQAEKEMADATDRMARSLQGSTVNWRQSLQTAFHALEVFNRMIGIIRTVGRVATELGERNEQLGRTFNTTREAADDLVDSFADGVAGSRAFMTEMGELNASLTTAGGASRFAGEMFGDFIAILGQVVVPENLRVIAGLLGRIGSVINGSAAGQAVAASMERTRPVLGEWQQGIDYWLYEQTGGLFGMGRPNEGPSPLGGPELDIGLGADTGESRVDYETEGWLAQNEQATGPRPNRTFAGQFRNRGGGGGGRGAADFRSQAAYAGSVAAVQESEAAILESIRAQSEAWAELNEQRREQEDELRAAAEQGDRERIESLNEEMEFRQQAHEQQMQWADQEKAAMTAWREMVKTQTLQTINAIGSALQNTSSIMGQLAQREQTQIDNITSALEASGASQRQIAEATKAHEERLDNLKKAEGGFIIAYSTVMAAVETAQAIASGAKYEFGAMAEHIAAAAGFVAAAVMAGIKLGDDGSGGGGVGAASPVTARYVGTPERETEADSAKYGTNLTIYTMGSDSARLGEQMERARWEMERSGLDAAMMPSGGYE